MTSATSSAPAVAWLPPLLLALAGACAALVLSASPPRAAGAARLADPAVVLGLFDVLWIVLLAWPGAARGGNAPVLVALGAPFHAAIASAAAAGPGHAGAWALVAGAWMLVGWAADRLRPARYALLLGLAAIAVPSAAYACADFGGLPTLGGLWASPAIAPVLLAHTAPSAGVADALPAVATAAVTLALLLVPGGSGPEEAA